MAHETDPDQHSSNPLGEALQRGVDGGYERRMAESPKRTEAAHGRAEEALGVLASGLERFDFPTEVLRAGLEEHGAELRSILARAAFDYSVERPNGDVDVVSSEVMIVPSVYGLSTGETFLEMLGSTRLSVLAMRLHRHTSGLGPVTDPDPEFASDFMAINGDLPFDEASES